MARTETILRVFVASPGDIKEERQILNDVIQELNDTWSKTLRIRLEFVGWETHSYPNFGGDAQAVINEEIEDDYDIFVGIMWARFGTPTGRAGSGTEEEFYRAYERHKTSPDETKIMFYFKDAPISPSDLIPEQLGLIQRFKAQLGGKGGYYWTFTDREEFAQFVRMHLSRQVQDWSKESSREKTEIATESPEVEEADNATVFDEDEGFLDLIEISTDKIELMKESLLRIGGATEELTVKMNAGAEELRANNNIKEAKRVINRVANALENFSSLLETEVPIFSQSYSDGIEAFSRAFSLMGDFGDVKYEDIETLESQMGGFKVAIVTAQIQTTQFIDAIASSPRTTTPFNKAKRRAISVLEKLNDELTKASNLSEEIENVIGQMKKSIKQSADERIWLAGE